MVWSSSTLTIFALTVVAVEATHLVKTTKLDGTDLNLIVWMCPDHKLYDIVEIAIRRYSSVDDMTNAIRELLTGYRDQLWSINALVYTRATADVIPLRTMTSRNVCFVTVSAENVIVFVTSMATSL